MLDDLYRDLLGVPGVLATVPQANDLGVHTSVGVSGPHGFVERVARFVLARKLASIATRLTFVTIGRNVPRGEAGWVGMYF
jgi:hypothetical protein